MVVDTQDRSIRKRPQGYALLCRRGIFADVGFRRCGDAVWSAQRHQATRAAACCTSARSNLTSPWSTKQATPPDPTDAPESVQSPRMAFFLCRQLGTIFVFADGGAELISRLRDAAAFPGDLTSSSLSDTPLRLLNFAQKSLPTGWLRAVASAKHA